VASPERPELASALRERLGRLLGAEVVGARFATGGYTPTARWSLELGDGRRAFAKVATNDAIAGWLRREAWVYENVAASCLPRYLGFEDHTTEPVLLIEDLSHAAWPPPWERSQVDAVFAALEELHTGSWPLPPETEGLADGTVALDGWATVAGEPEPFLGLGLRDASWLEAALPVLVEAEARATLHGEVLCHYDVRSDNLCFVDGEARLIDWNLACPGNPRFDMLHAEGGPPPWELMPCEPALAAGISGFFAARAGLPVIPRAPGVRKVQYQQLVPALAWAERELGVAAARPGADPTGS
jgi:hypothetical protein